MLRGAVAWPRNVERSHHPQGQLDVEAVTLGSQVPPGQVAGPVQPVADRLRVTVQALRRLSQVEVLGQVGVQGLEQMCGMLPVVVQDGAKHAADEVGEIRPATGGEQES